MDLKAEFTILKMKARKQNKTIKRITSLMLHLTNREIPIPYPEMNNERANQSEKRKTKKAWNNLRSEKKNTQIAMGSKITKRIKPEHKLETTGTFQKFGEK